MTTATRLQIASASLVLLAVMWSPFFVYVCLAGGLISVCGFGAAIAFEKGWG